jgi:hypothetical protein
VWSTNNWSFYSKRGLSEMKITWKYGLLNTLGREVFSFLAVKWSQDNYRLLEEVLPYCVSVSLGRESAAEDDSSNFNTLWVQDCLTSQPTQTRLVTDRPVAVSCNNYFDASFVVFVLFQNIFTWVIFEYYLVYDISEKVSQDIIFVGSLTIHGTITIKYVLILMGKWFRNSICNIAEV